MPATDEQAQESKTESVSIAVTPSEKEDVKLVVMIDKPEGGASMMLRDLTLTEVLQRAKEIRARLAAVAAGEPAGAAH